MRMLVNRIVASLALLALAPPAAHAQWQGTQGWGQRVNADYTPNPSGAYRFYPNRTSAGWFNFAVIYDHPHSWDRRRIPMADPTIVKVDGWYYVTGTTDAARNNTNFAIYRSQNLVDWFPHMLAFQETNATTYTQILEGPFTGASFGANTKTVNGIKHRQMWAPQLYVDPGNPNLIWLSFTAARGDDFVQDCGAAPRTPPRSVYCATITKQRFVQGGQSRYFALNAWEPMTYFYEVDNVPGAGALDGGFAQGKNIPVSGIANAGNFDPCAPPPPCGSVYQTGKNSYGHGCIGANTWMALDSFVYFDALNANKRWMMYTWYVDAFHVVSGGNHVAAYPMRDNRKMDAFGEHLPIAYRFHWWYWPSKDPGCNAPCSGSPGDMIWPDPTPPDCWILNGTSNAHAKRLGGCGSKNYAVAEGPAAFSRNGRTYVLYSRNAWNSPAYGIYYRHVQGTFRDARLSSWTDYTTPERPLVSAVHPAKTAIPGGASFGHGEVFEGPTVPGQPQAYYLIFHAKEQGTPTGIQGNPYSYPSGYSGRTVYFKEITFNPDGSMVVIENGDTSDEADTEGFLIPGW